MEGIPCLYQISAVYRSSGKVGLVTVYGEYIGTYLFKDIYHVSDRPLFHKEDYEIGTHVVWADYEDVYEGVIEELNDTTAKIGQIKKLLPVDYKLRLPYWKIPEGRKPKS